jgi:hypothetical protein
MKKYRKVNRMFDENPMIFGMIPLSLIYPLAGFVLVSYLIFAVSNNWIAGLATFLTCTSSYAILTAKGSHNYLSRIFQTPPRYIRLPLPFLSFIQHLNDLDRQKSTKADSQKRSKR